MLRGILILLCFSFYSCGPGVSTVSKYSGNYGSSKPISRVQGTPFFSSNNTSGSILMSSAPVIGDLIVVYVALGNTSISGVSDNYSNTYLNAVTAVEGSGKAGIYYTIVQNTGSAFSITVSLGATVSFTLSASEYSGILTTNPLDRVSSNNGGSVSTLGTGYTPYTNQNNELIVAMVETSAINNQTFTINTPGWLSEFTQGTCPSNAVCATAAYSIVSAAGLFSQSWNWTFTSYAAASIATFKGVSP